jgi:hypothetical protein
MPTVYVLHESIDLGSHVIGVFSSPEKLREAEELYRRYYAKIHPGQAPTLFMEENELNEITIGYGARAERHVL